MVKHAVLALLIERLKAKDTAFRVIDTHAGVGLYDLTAERGGADGRVARGIGRVWGRPRPDLAALLAPYLAAVGRQRRRRALARYPGRRGSPAISSPAGPANRRRAAP